MENSFQEQILASLQRQEKLLEKLLAAQAKGRLGFHQDAGTVRIYCNRSNNCLWYKLDNGNPLPIIHNALTGCIADLRFEKVERRGKEVHKLLTAIDADKQYLLESGFDSHFSKCILSAIAILTQIQLQQPITIAVAPGDDEAVLFARIYSGSEYIKVGYDSDTNFREVSKAAIANVRKL